MRSKPLYIDQQEIQMKTTLFAMAAGLVIATSQPALIASASAAEPTYGAPISLEDARQVASTADATAKTLGLHDSIVVVDPSGALVLVNTMTDTQYASADIAIAKASTAARFRRPSKVFDDAVSGGRIGMAFLTGATPIQGGVPLMRAGKVIGAVGISGGTGDQDQQVATAAAAAVH